MTRRKWATVSRAGIVLAAVFACQAAASLGWNVDFDTSGVPPYITGAGVPGDTFGAASGQTGKWNSVRATGLGLYSLVDVFGNATGVQYHGDGMSGTGGGYNDPYNVGDYRLIMNDFNQFGGRRWFEVSGIPDGRYQVWTYAATPWSSYNPVSVTVVGADPGQNPQVVTGPLTPNQFGLLVTHSVHDVTVRGGVLRVELSPSGGATVGITNGFQIVPVPEPATLIAMGGALAALLIRKGRFRPRRTKEHI